jgi:hypothetical protein
MHGEEVVLFLGVAALSLAIVVSVVAPILRQRRAPAAGWRPVTRPTARAAPAQASAGDPGALTRGATACAACHGQWPRGFRFCPLDGSSLGAGAVDPAPDRAGGDFEITPAVSRELEPAVGTGAKICPSCARRYRHDAAVCARDGSALIAMN